jgi:hypothetical protein
LKLYDFLGGRFLNGSAWLLRSTERLEQYLSRGAGGLIGEYDC